jgi:hypothetical protein
MKLNKLPRKAVDAETDLWYRQVAQQVNGLSEGRISALYQTVQSVPTVGDYSVGDFVSNASVTELGTAGNKYIIHGWKCSSVSPLTFLQCRFLTGN